MASSSHDFNRFHGEQHRGWALSLGRIDCLVGDIAPCSSPLLPMYILMKGFTPPDVGSHEYQRRLVMLLPNYIYIFCLFDPQIRRTNQLQVQIIQEIQASINYMGNGKSPNCLPLARVTTVCSAGILRRD